MKTKAILLSLALSIQCLQLYSQSNETAEPADSTGTVVSDTISIVTPDPSVDGIDDSGEGGNDRIDPNNPDPPEPPEPTDPEGDSLADAINLGLRVTNISYTSTVNTLYNTNQYTGRSTNDVFYTFMLGVPMNVTITNEGSVLQDTYLYLLDSSGTLIISNDNYSGEGHCSNTAHAFINRQLEAGTYYVVSEGYSANGSITTNITSNVESGYSYPSIPSTYSTDPGNAVGGMGGAFGVSSMGGATYSIPIDVPAGIHGLQPNISITYNSQSGNGIVGYGTGISGLSCITRGPMDIYHDSSATGLTYLSTDALYLDGERLMLVSGTSGLPNAVYSPESSPFTTVTVKGSYSDSNNSTWFEVHTPDGMIYYYGHDTQGENSRLSYTDQSNRTKVLSWYISKCVDPLGNYISYSYTQDGYTCYPYAIHYGGNENNSTDLDNSIMFTYTARSDVIPFKFDGKSGSVSWLLSSVSCKTGSSVYRTYAMNYNTTSDGTARKFSRLVSVTEKNAQNETLPATRFGWSYLPSIAYASNSLSVNSPNNLPSGVIMPFSDQLFTAGDVNGDGLSDVIGLSVVENNGNNWTTINTIADVYYATTDENGNHSYVTSGDYYNLGYIGQILCVNTDLNGQMNVDIDGDGTNEQIISLYENVGGNYPRIIFCIINQKFDGEDQAFNLSANSKPLLSNGDYDNDGRDEIAYLETEETSGVYKLRILEYSDQYLQGQNNMIKYCAVRDITLSSAPKQLVSSDMDGDGLLDLLILCESGYKILWNSGSTLFSNTVCLTNSTLSYSHMTTCGDFNGDGLLDLLTNASGSSSWYFLLNQGDGTFTSQLACTLNIYEQYFTDRDNDKFHVDVFDFDGDGRSDAVITKATYIHRTDISGGWGEFDKTHTYWMRSTGTGLSQVYHATSNRAADAIACKYITGDFDGDGIVELANYGFDCANGTNSNSDPVWRIYKNSNLTVQSGKVTSVTGDFGATTGITYTTLTSSGVYSKGGTDSYPAPRYTIPMNVVRQTVENNGAAGSMTTQYSYEGLRVHLQGRGLLGFSKVTANNTTMGVTTESGVTEWSSVYYVPTVTYLHTTVGSLTSQTENTMFVMGYGSKKYFSYLYQTVETDFDGNSATTDFFYNYTNGYITNKEETSYSGDYFTCEVAYSDYSQYGGAYRPGTVTVTRTHPDDGLSFSRTTKYTYDSTTGLVTQRKDNQGTSLELTTNYTYDAWGNVLSQSSTGSGITSCTTYYKYDSTHRFPLRTYTSPSSSVLRRTYDTWGHVLTEQDSVNTSIQNTVTYTYDGFGNLTLTEIPGNGEIRYTRGWSHDPSQRWFVLEQGSHRPWVKTWYDNRGREVRTESVGPDNTTLTGTTTYNSKGLVSGRSTTEGSLTLSTTYTYDNRGRVLSETAPGNDVTTYSYSGCVVNSTISRSVAVTHNGRTVTTAYDLWGGVVSVSDPSSQNITYSYNSNGQPDSVTVGNIKYTFEYDAVGNRTSLSDPDAGTTTYTYDALGRETGRNDGRGIAFSTTYDYLGRVTARTAGSEQITYTYGTSGTGSMRLTQETNGSMTRSYEYDSYGHCTKVTHMGNNTTYSYTTDGLLSSVTHPGNKTDTYTYDSYGNVSGMNAVSGGMTWSRTGYTGASATSSLALQNGSYPFVRTTSLDSNGMLNAMSLTRNSATLRGESYTFSPVTGNLTSRTVGNTTETFTYDLLDRLKKVQTGNQTTLEMTYSANGNIASKTGIGDYEYSSSSKPHAVVAVDNTAGIIPEHTQSVTYNAWGKVSEITSVIGSDTYQYTITYGPDLERWFTYYKKNGVIQYYTYYGVGYENCYHQEPGTTAYTLRTYYVDTPDGLSGIVRYDSRTSTYTPYAVETDHLGSITALYNSSGTKVMGASFDAWGKRTVTTGTLEFRRGYTGHEHIDGYDLINMNGRVYDPLIGRFLSPDMYVQLPGFSQSFNRYSYCLNNPLKYTDPDGEFWETIFFDPITFGIGNTMAHCIRGDINNFGDVLCYFGQGALAGAAITTTWCLAPCVPIAGDLFQASLIGQVYFNIGAMALGMSSGIVRTIIKQNPTTLINSMELLLGNYYIDENAGFGEGVWQGYSRHTWESIQTTAGQLYSQGKNFIWNAERVDYLGGATYMTNEMSSSHNGVTIGNYISINIPGRIDKEMDFDTYVCSNPMFMHEYGHTYDSREMGPMYLFTIGIPSAKSAKHSSIENGLNHNWYWTELRANRAAKKYFGRHYKVDWSQYETDVESKYYYPVVAPTQEMIEKRIDYIKRLYRK